MKRSKILTNFISPSINTSQSLKLLKKVLSKEIPNEGFLTKKFEKNISNQLRVKYVTATTSGTMAIFLALKALKIGYSDEVIIPNITFAATANAVILSGAKPILVDINENNLLIDINKIKKKINKKTKAIIAVHVSGRGSNIKQLKTVSKKYNIKLIEDAAEAYASKFDNKSLGTFGDIGCFSFSPPKIFTTGQGGALVTNNNKLYKEIIRLKNQGRVGNSNGGEDTFLTNGYNLKFTNIQSALGISQLKNINKRKKKLIGNYKFYKKNIKENSNFKIFKFDLKSGEIPLWTDVYCKKRNKLFNYLFKKGIECRYFWHPLNYCKPYKQSFKNLETSQKLKGKLMWLPSSFKLKKIELVKICKLINEFNEKYNG